MNLSSIKEEYLSKRVGFGKSSTPLHKRDDIDDLAIMAIESQNPNLLKLFVQPMPELATLKKSKTDQKLKGIAEAVRKSRIGQ